jgi:ketosteroid isomerase-like protein
MSQESVEIVRRMVAAFNSDDPRQAIGCFHPEIEFTTVFTEGETYVGLQGMRQYGDDLVAVWENWHSEDNSFVDAGGEKVVWLYRIVGRGKGSGVPVDQPVAIVWTLRDGLIWRGQAFLDRREALVAAGLPG